jgi:hypothetical protein
VIVDNQDSRIHREFSADTPRLGAETRLYVTR